MKIALCGLPWSAVAVPRLRTRWSAPTCIDTTSPRRGHARRTRIKARSRREPKSAPPQAASRRLMAASLSTGVLGLPSLGP